MVGFIKTIWSLLKFKKGVAMKVIILAGSEKDLNHVLKIATPFYEWKGLPIKIEVHYLSAHKQTKQLLTLLEQNAKEKVIYITIAGKSNALSGMVAGNTDAPVIACPPWHDLPTYMADIHSTLRMPSYTPVLTVIDPGNCVLAVERIMRLAM